MEEEKRGSGGPRISGFSTPVGSSTKKKQESPAQRSEAINQQNLAQAQPAPVRKQKPIIERREVSQEEIENYRKKRGRKIRTTTICAILLLVIASAVGLLLYKKFKKVQYDANASFYNDAIPIVANNGQKSFLISQSGNKISSDYDYIANYNDVTTLAINFNDGQYEYSILDIEGKEITKSNELIEKVNEGHNYLLHEENNVYLADVNGKKLNEAPIINASNDNYEYTLVKNDTKISLIDKDGKEKFARVIDNFEVTSFDYAKNPYEDIYYCAITYSMKSSKELIIYNCETSKEVKTISEVGIYADFYDSETPMLQTGSDYYYFYGNDMLFSSNQPSVARLGGIIETVDVEGKTVYFDPKNKEMQEAYPSHTLIAQNKLDKTTEIDESCNDYEVRESQDLIKICDNIYSGKNLLKLDYENYKYELLPKKLADYLKYLGKNYIVRTNVGTGAKSIYDIDAKSTVKGLENVAFSSNNGEESSFVRIRGNTNNRTYYNLITDETIELESTDALKLGANELTVEIGGETHYYNKNGKDIYKIKKGE